MASGTRLMIVYGSHQLKPYRTARAYVICMQPCSSTPPNPRAEYPPMFGQNGGKHHAVIWSARLGTTIIHSRIYVSEVRDGKI